MPTQHNANPDFAAPLTAAAAVPSWEELLQLIKDAEPHRIVACQKCGISIPDCLRYQGILITEWTFAGNDGVQCDDCARSLYLIAMSNFDDDFRREEMDAWSDEMKRWDSLRNRRVNAALKRCGVQFRIHKPRTRR